MRSDEGSPGTEVRFGKPLWWWFLVHGLLAIVYGAVTLLTPFDGAAGFLVDGFAFATLAFVGGAQIMLLGIISRRLVRGWVMLLVVGAHAFAAGIAFGIVAALGLPVALFWCIVSFLGVQGLLLLLGFFRAPTLRLWTMLMGGCMVVASAALTSAWLLDAGHSFDIPDAALGITGLLYGFAVFVAALQARMVSNSE